MKAVVIRNLVVRNNASSNCHQGKDSQQGTQLISDKNPKLFFPGIVAGIDV
jgi:hypothetical protein